MFIEMSEEAHNIRRSQLMKHFKSCCAERIMEEHPNKESLKKFCRKLETMQWTLTKMRLRYMECGNVNGSIGTEHGTERIRSNIRNLGMAGDSSDDHDEIDE